MILLFKITFAISIKRAKRPNGNFLHLEYLELEQ